MHRKIALRHNGKPSVSFATNSSGAYKLKITNCSDDLCSDVNKTTIDSSNSAGLYNTITFVTKKRAAISYFDSTNKNLKVAVKKSS